MISTGWGIQGRQPGTMLAAAMKYLALPISPPPGREITTCRHFSVENQGVQKWNERSLTKLSEPRSSDPMPKCLL
jgi:hypothetical protein